MKRRRLFLASILTFAFCAGAFGAFGTAGADTAYRYAYDFSAESQTGDFIATIDPQDNNEAYTDAGYVTYTVPVATLFPYNSDAQCLTAAESAMSGNDRSGNISTLVFNTRTFTYFEIEADIRYEASARDGWAGISLGITDLTRQARWGDNPNGMMLFLQGDGKPTYATSKLDGSNWKDGAAPGIVTAQIADYVNTASHTHKVRVWAGHIEYYIDGNKVIDLSGATLPANQIGDGKIGVFCTNRPISFDAVRINPLNAAGETEVPAESLTISGKPSAGAVGTPITVNANVGPVTASNKNFILSAAPAQGWSVSGSSIVFKEPGAYTVTAAASSAPDVTDSFPITVSGYDFTGRLPYPFTPDGMAKFDAAHIESNSVGGDAAYSSMFELSDGVLKRVSDTTDVTADWGVLYLKDREPKNFEITFRAKSTSKNGWFGLAFNKNEIYKPAHQEGEALFMQVTDKKATSWGIQLGGPTEYAVDSFKHGEWSLFKFKVFGASSLTAEMYVDNMSVPFIKKNISSATGRLGIFATTSETEFKDLHYGILNNAGAVVNYVPVAGVAIADKRTGAEVGDSFNMNASLAPANASFGTIVYGTTNSNVAAVNAEGRVTILMPGSATITATAKDDPSKSDSFTLTAEYPQKPVTGVSIVNKRTGAKTGDAPFVLAVTVSPADASDMSLDFASSDTAVATVDGNGRVTVKGAGQTVITVTSAADPSKSDSFTLTVTDGQPAQEPGPGQQPGEGDGTETEKTGCGSCDSAAAALIAAGAAILFAAVRRKVR